MSFRPSIWVTLLVGACVATQLRLAAWQYGRHQGQTERLELVTDRMKQAPTTDLKSPQPWQKALLSGTFEPNPMFITGRFEFGGPGLDIVSVLRMESGERLLVNRGWVPLDRWTDADTLAPPGAATLDGLLLPADASMLPTGCVGGGTRTLPLPATDTMPERWAGPNWPAISTKAHVDQPVLLVLGPELTRSSQKSSTDLPATGYIARPKRIGHLDYAGQWFLIAVVFTMGWLYTGFRRGAQLSD